jgi:hypothetical protein
MDLKEQILVALGLNKAEEEVKLAWQAKGEDGTIYVSTAEELESGVDISVLTEDGTTILLPVGTYKTDTGVSFRVETEGIVAEVIESETEEEVTEEEMSEEVELAPEDESRAEETDWAKTYEEMKEKVENLEDAIADIKARLGEGDSEEVEMTEETTEEASDSPKTVTTKTTEVVEFTAEEVEAIKAENKKLKTELAASPADAPINVNKFSVERKPLSKREYKKLSKQERFWYNLNK